MLGHGQGGAAVWDVSSRRQVAVFGGADHRVYTAAFSPNAPHVAFAGDCTLLDDPANVNPSRKLESYRPGACGAQIWSLAERRMVRRLSVVDYPSNQIAYSPDGQVVAVLNAAMQVELWEAATGRLIQTLKGAKQGGRCLEFSPDGSRVMACDDRELLFWDITSGQLVNTFRAGGRINHAAFSPDGRTVAVSGASPVVIFLETPDRRRVPTVRRNRPHELCCSR